MRKLAVLVLWVGMAWAGQARAGCVPVMVEAGVAMPRVADAAGPGCIAWQRVAGGIGRARSAEVLVFADPQPQTTQDVDYYRRDIVAPLVGRHRASLGLSLGDIVDDEPALFPAMREATARLGVPWLHVPGNHDIDPGATSDDAALGHYHREIGPDTHARMTRLATFVGLDDVISTPGRKPAYIGGLREDQYAFLQRYLPTLPKDKLLVLAMHIPLFDKIDEKNFRDADRTRLFALLAPFPHVLILSAHSHGQRNVFHDASDGWLGATPLHEFNVGAACGAYWSGVKDADGIPDARMGDGSPNGYAVLTLKPMGGYALEWHAARDPADTQIGLHAPKALRRGAYPAWGVFANYYMGDDASRLEFRVDDGEWKPMKKVDLPDPSLTEENMRDDLAEALRGFDRSPEAEISPHLWRAALPTKLAAGAHRIEVRAFDRWRGVLTASTSYTLLDAAP